MSQEMHILSSSQSVLNSNQVEALRSLSNLLSREISSLESSPETVSDQIMNGRNICLTKEVQKFESALIRCALICSMGRQNIAAKMLGLKNTTLNEKIRRLNIQLTESDEI